MTLMSNPVGRPPKYKFKSMSVGDSFVIHIGDKDPENVRKSIWICAKSSLGNSGLISTRTVMTKDGLGFRVTRIDPEEVRREKIKAQKAAPPKAKSNKSRNERILRLVSKGNTYAKAASLAGVSRSTVAGVVYRQASK